MGKSVNPNEKIIQRSVCIRNRHQNFLYWAEKNIPDFDWNKLVRDKIDEQIVIFAPQFLEEND